MTRSVLLVWASWLDTGKTHTQTDTHTCVRTFLNQKKTHCLSLSFYRIMGLYVSVVLVIGKFVRGFFSEISHSIMFEELPCVDRILKLCTDIFLVSFIILGQVYYYAIFLYMHLHAFNALLTGFLTKTVFHNTSSNPSLIQMYFRCARQENLNLKRNFTPNSSSFIDLRKQ